MGNKWISVKEKIPYCGGHFLVHDTNGHEYKAVFIDKHWQSRYPYPIKEWLEETEEPVSNESIGEDEMEKQAELRYPSHPGLYLGMGNDLKRIGFREGYKAALKKASVTPNEMVCEDEYNFVKILNRFYRDKEYKTIAASSDCVKLAKQYSNTKLEELEKWVNEEIEKLHKLAVLALTDHNNPFTGRANDLKKLKEKIKLLK